MVVDKVGETAQVDERERTVDAHGGGEGGELGGVHDQFSSGGGQRGGQRVAVRNEMVEATLGKRSSS
jgi:hypothetical protein